MKLLVFSQTPPSSAAQRAIAKLMRASSGAETRDEPPEDAEIIDCYHVDCGQSEQMSDADRFRWKHAWFVMRACAEAIWRRVRFDIRHLYYVPAPGRRPALYRDWMILAFCRSVFPHVVCDWQRTGLGDWLKREGTLFERWVTHRLLRHPALSLSDDVLTMRDGLWFVSRENWIVEPPGRRPTGTDPDSR